MKAKHFYPKVVLLSKKLPSLLIILCIIRGVNGQKDMAKVEELKKLCVQEHPINNNLSANVVNIVDDSCFVAWKTYLTQEDQRELITWEEAFGYCHCNKFYGKFNGNLATYPDMAVGFLPKIYDQIKDHVEPEFVSVQSAKYDPKDEKWYWLEPGKAKREILDGFWLKGATKDEGFATTKTVAGFELKDGQYALNAIEPDKVNTFMCNYHAGEEVATDPNSGIDYGFDLELLKCPEESEGGEEEADDKPEDANKTVEKKGKTTTTAPSGQPRTASGILSTGLLAGVVLLLSTILQ